MKMNVKQLILGLYFLASLASGSPFSEILDFESRLKENGVTSEAHAEILRELIFKAQTLQKADIAAEVKKDDAEDKLNRLFQIKVLARESNLDTSSIVVSLKRKALMSLRYVEDLIAENYNSKVTKKRTDVLIPFEGDGIFNQSTSKTIDLGTLKSGDVLLIRGDSIISATIGRVSESPYIHSHIGMVYVDEKTAERFFVESLAHTGVVLTPLEKAFDHSYSRINVYRAKDEKVAQEAGRFAYETAIFSVNNDNAFGFDFSMDMSSFPPVSKMVSGNIVKYAFDASNKEQCRFFCSKFIAFSFAEANESDLLVPKFPGAFRSKVDPILRTIDIPDQIRTTFFPGDIDVDPGFNLVHEYRNPNMTIASRIDDAVLDETMRQIANGKILKIGTVEYVFGKMILSVVQSKIPNQLLRKFGIKISRHTTVGMTLGLVGLQKILSDVKGTLESKHKTGVIDLNKLNFAELSELVHVEMFKSAKVRKLLIDPSTARIRANSCISVYR